MKFTNQAIQLILDGFPPDLIPEDEVRAVRNDPDAGIRHISMPDAVLRESAGAGKQIRYLMSSETPLGPFKDSIKVSGWDLGDFKKRGMPFLFNHNSVEAHSMLPLGHMGKVTKGTVREIRALSGDAHFTPDGTSPFNDLVRLMVEEDFMRGGSVGFVPTEMREPTKKEAEAEGSDFGPMSLIFTSTQLIEFSATPVGMDPDATVIRSGVMPLLEARLQALIQEGVFNLEVVQEYRVKTLGLTAVPSTPTVFDFGAPRGDSGLGVTTNQPGVTVTTGAAGMLEFGDNTTIPYVPFTLPMQVVDAPPPQPIPFVLSPGIEQFRALEEKVNALVSHHVTTIGELRGLLMVEQDRRAELESQLRSIQEAFGLVVEEPEPLPPEIRSSGDVLWYDSLFPELAAE